MATPHAPHHPAAARPSQHARRLDDAFGAICALLSLWCRHGFADKISATTAQPGVMLSAYDAPAGTIPKVFMIRVNTAGRGQHAYEIPLGGGKP